MLKNGNKVTFIFYLITLFLFRAPPFYIVPSKSLIYSSHTFATLILSILFITLLIEKIKNYKKTLNASNNKVILFVLFYFFSQSISILLAINIIEYIKVYKNLVLGIMFFIVSFIIINNSKKIISISKVLIGASFLNLIIQVIIYLKPLFLYSFLSNVLYEGYWKGVLVQAERNRYFIDFFDGSLIPLMFYFFINVKHFIQKLFYILLIFLSCSLALISNFRIELVMVLFTTIGTIPLIIKSKQYIVFYLILIAIFLYIGRTISVSSIGYSSFERLLLEDKGDIQTIITRTYYWSRAIDMGLSSPILGIGLGNYYDHLNLNYIEKSAFGNEKKVMDMTLIHPHNIFFAALAETGLIGLIATISLFGYFFINDYKRLKTSNNLTKLLIISFWSLFISSLTGPRIIIQYIILFWAIRIMIEKESAYFPP